MADTVAPTTVKPTTIEPLEKLGRFAVDWAETLCDPAHGCTSYHKMWSLVRLLESNGALPAGEAFFDRELAKVGRDGHARVVLSGGADTGLMTLACNALLRASLTPEVVMIDRCATPLEQCKLYAAANGIDLTTIKGTVDQLGTLEADALLAHSFVVFLPHSERPALFAAWAKALRIGGRVIMSQRLVPEGVDYKRDRPPSEISQRRIDLRAALLVNNPTNHAVDDLLDVAEQFWTNKMGGNPVRLAELHDLAANAGFEVTRIDYDHGKTNTSPFALDFQAVKRPRAEIVLTRIT